jgi:Tol biopolymer transport system component
VRLFPLRRLTVAMLPALLWVGASPVRAHHISARSYGGAILAAITTYRGNSQVGEVLTVGRGTAHVLLHRPGMAFYSLAPSPDGLRVAALSCCFPATIGVWAFNRDGTHLHRVVRVPPSPCNPLGAGSIVWSPGGRRLAYIVDIPSDAIFTCPPGVRDVTGVWVTPYDDPRPRMVEFDNYVATSPPLSWSPDGRTLAVNGRRGGANVRAVDVATGASRPLVRGGYAGIYAPVTGALAYLTGGWRPSQLTRIWVAGAQGHRRHILGSAALALAASPLVWSPNGRSVAYVTDTGSMHPRGARTLAIAGAAAPHQRTLVAARDGVLDFPAWSPDGLNIGYSGAASCACPSTSTPGIGAAIFTVDVGTGVRHIRANSQQLLAGQRPPSQADVTSIAWAVR